MDPPLSLFLSLSMCVSVCVYLSVCVCVCVCVCLSCMVVAQEREALDEVDGARHVSLNHSFLPTKQASFSLAPSLCVTAPGTLRSCATHLLIEN